jgi:NAD-dependent histone deacetylase SIR2
MNSSPNMMELVLTLNRAMVKVKSIRNRLDTLVTVEDAINSIKKASKILVITGAGISTSIGIPDFRSSKGFYSQIQHLGLTDPQEVFDLENFHMDPSLFYSIAHMIIPPERVFSPLHAFVRVLQDKGKLLRNYTQNIDNLESYAGILPEKLIQCHGSFATASCITCGYQISGEEIFPDIRKKQIPNCPKCAKTKHKLMKNEDNYIPESFGVFKPDITFFGEPLPKLFHDLIMKDLNQCDLLISIGTSLKVAPVADIVDKIPQDVPQLLINKDPINHCNFDVSLLGYCDDVASFIANKLGDDWEIPHNDYNTIRGVNGTNLVVELVDRDFREYEVTNVATTTSQPVKENLQLSQELDTENDHHEDSDKNNDSAFRNCDVNGTTEA